MLQPHGSAHGRSDREADAIAIDEVRLVLVSERSKCMVWGGCFISLVIADELLLLVRGHPQNPRWGTRCKFFASPFKSSSVDGMRFDVQPDITAITHSFSHSDRRPDSKVPSGLLTSCFSPSSFSRSC